MTVSFAPTGADAPKRSRRREARPAELLAAALDLFVEHGFAGAKVEDIARRAGVSKGTVFLYYPSKEELFKAVVRENVGNLVAHGTDIVASFQGSSSELLTLLVTGWWRRLGATKASGITKLMVSEASHFPDLAAFYDAEVVRPAIALIESVLRRGVARGEFVEHDIARVGALVTAPMMFLVMWKHSVAPCAPRRLRFEPQSLVDQHAALLVAALSKGKQG